MGSGGRGSAQPRKDGESPLTSRDLRITRWRASCTEPGPILNHDGNGNSSNFLSHLLNSSTVFATNSSIFWSRAAFSRIKSKFLECKSKLQKMWIGLLVLECLALYALLARRPGSLPHRGSSRELWRGCLFASSAEMLHGFTTSLAATQQECVLPVGEISAS